MVRNTIISLVVLGALLVILVPLLKQSLLVEDEKTLSIPAEPAFPNPISFDVQTGSIQSTLKEVLHSPLSSPQAWVLQVEETNNTVAANTLVNNLRQKGFNAYAKSIQTNTGQLMRVFVGPLLHEEQAKALASNLNKSLKLNAFVIHYDPISED